MPSLWHAVEDRRVVRHLGAHTFQTICSQMAVRMKNGVFWDVTPCPLVRTDVSEELSASIRVTRIGELGTTLAVTRNRRKLRRNTK
jgi:hypothetical protein